MSKRRRNRTRSNIRKKSTHRKHDVESAGFRRKLPELPDLEPDLDIEFKGTTAEAEKILKEAEEAGVEVFTKTYKSNELRAPFHEAAFKGVENAPSLNYRGDALPPGAIAQSLLNIAGYNSHAGPLTLPGNPPHPTLDDRPLIDILHEATFTMPPGMYGIRDAYALRMLLRKAHCFTLDEYTSRLVADFSMATATDLEAARRLAMPPFNVTWIELDNHARLKRMKELNVPLTHDDPNSPPTKRIGWLIQPSPNQGGWFATYVTLVEQGIWVAPISYWWHAGEPNPDRPPEHTSVGKLMEWVLFGTAGNVNPFDAFLFPSDVQIHYAQTPAKEVIDAMSEMAGELRHIWGLLIALGLGELGAQYSPQAKPLRAPPTMKNGKPLLPLEHKVLHLHLNKKLPAQVITQAITHHHNRLHEVRAHWRSLKSGKRVPVRSHSRGDEKLGRIEKTYRVEK